MNREEQIANAEKATVDSIREQRFAKTAELVKIPGHPLHTFYVGERSTCQND